MQSLAVRLVFIALCYLGAGAVGFVGWQERVRFNRGESTLGPRHLRWRIASTSLWVLVLVLLGSATAFFWPNGPADRVDGHRFITTVSVALALMLVALVLLVFDIWTTAREQKLYRARIETELNALAQEEIFRVQLHEDESAGAHS